MCSVVILRRPGSEWPLLLAANRDEALSRPWDGPARHWPDRAEVVAGRDRLAGGSWLGINDQGVVAAVLNRVGTLGPAPGKRSRGELVLDALDYDDAASAAAALADLDPEAYRPFNLIVADAVNGYWLRRSEGLPGFAFRRSDGRLVTVDPARMPDSGIREPSPTKAADEIGREAMPGGAGAIECFALPDGLAMLTAHDLDDPASPRIRLHRRRFAAAAVPDPARGDWAGWIGCIASREPLSEPTAAMTIVTDGDYGTVCSSLIALPADGPPRLWFAPGPPDRMPFAEVQLETSKNLGDGNAI